MTYEIRRFGTVVSTNALAVEAGARGERGTAPLGPLAFVARAQTGGRGRQGRAWVSEPGGLYLSLLLRPEDLSLARASGADLPVLSLAVALGISEALGALTRTTFACPKWPNDLLFAGKKVGGILAEARFRGASLEFLVLGVGINVGNPLPDLACPAPASTGEIVASPTAHPWPPSTLRDELPVPPPLARVEEVVLAALETVVASFDAETIPQVLTRFERAAGYPARVLVRGGIADPPRSGVALGLTRDGALRFRNERGIEETLVSGELVSATTPS